MSTGGTYQNETLVSTTLQFPKPYATYNLQFIGGNICSVSSVPSVTHFAYTRYPARYFCHDMTTSGTPQGPNKSRRHADAHWSSNVFTVRMAQTFLGGTSVPIVDQKVPLFTVHCLLRSPLGRRHCENTPFPRRERSSLLPFLAYHANLFFVGTFNYF